ncbi:MAG: hypothetical protein L0027_05725 [Candidatus Rokubacteria bacterium]|nr:hypothetical protein [Candidatus Rokubacteria bacterium]
MGFVASMSPLKRVHVAWAAGLSVLLALPLSLASIEPAAAQGRQSIGPSFGTGRPSGSGGRPGGSLAPDPIDQARGRALTPLPPLPSAPLPTERYVPERVIRDPYTGQTVVVPGHHERRLSDQQYQVPTLQTIPVDPPGRSSIAPGGTRPPADLRQGP